jgi:hypothetical protein
MRSFLCSAVCLTLITSAAALTTPHSYRELQERDAEKAKPHRKQQHNGVMRWFRNFFNKKQVAATDAEDDDTCYLDSYYDFVGELGEGFCQDYMRYPNTTYTVDYTPTR